MTKLTIAMCMVAGSALLAACSDSPIPPDGEQEQERGIRMRGTIRTGGTVRGVGYRLQGALEFATPMTSSSFTLAPAPVTLRSTPSGDE